MPASKIILIRQAEKPIVAPHLAQPKTILASAVGKAWPALPTADESDLAKAAWKQWHAERKPKT